MSNWEYLDQEKNFCLKMMDVFSNKESSITKGKTDYFMMNFYKNAALGFEMRMAELTLEQAEKKA
ncbi:MAG: hypothetical protein MJ179_08530 [Treponema sp.]|nr:hypothetical protein [Treponema sp.]